MTLDVMSNSPFVSQANIRYFGRSSYVQQCVGEGVGQYTRHDPYHTAIGKHLLEAHGSSCHLNENQFWILRKCRSKFECLVYEMLFIKECNPRLNTQSDSIRAKLFV